VSQAGIPWGTIALASLAGYLAWKFIGKSGSYEPNDDGDEEYAENCWELASATSPKPRSSLHLRHPGQDHGLRVQPRQGGGQRLPGGVPGGDGAMAQGPGAPRGAEVQGDGGPGHLLRGQQRARRSAVRLQAPRRGGLRRLRSEVLPAPRLHHLEGRRALLALRQPHGGADVDEPAPAPRGGRGVAAPQRAAPGWTWCPSPGGEAAPGRAGGDPVPPAPRAPEVGHGQRPGGGVQELREAQPPG
jgi:hypothetical protein